VLAVEVPADLGDVHGGGGERHVVHGALPPVARAAPGVRRVAVHLGNGDVELVKVQADEADAGVQSVEGVRVAEG